MIFQFFLRFSQEFIYNVQDRDNLKPLNFQQRFYLTCALNRNFSNLAIDLENQPSFTFVYPNDFYSVKPRSEKQYIGRIM